MAPSLGRNSGALAAEVAAGDPAELGVERREQPVEHPAVDGAEVEQELRDVGVPA